MTATLLRPGIEVPLLEPGSPAWLRTMSSSKVSAIVGLNRFESRFSVWHRMAGNIADEQTEVQSRGHFLEPAICAWFQSKHPELDVTITGSWQHADNALWVASPDRIATHRDTGEAFCVEAKSEGELGAWGTPGEPGDVPAGYRAQAIWEMGCTGTRRTYLPMIGPFLTFAEYVVEFDQAEFDYLAQQATAFLRTLPGGPDERMPDLDSSTATYETVRKLHPLIDDVEVDVPTEIGERYETACDALEAAETEATGAKAALLAAMNGGKKALLDGRQIAYRKPARGGSVALCRTKPKPATPTLPQQTKDTR